LTYAARKVAGSSETREFRRLAQALEEQLAASAGAIITVQDEGSDLAGAPHDTLNFVGAGVVAADAGSGVATVTVTPTVPGLQRIKKASNELRVGNVFGQTPGADSDLVGYSLVSGETYQVSGLLVLLGSVSTGQDLAVAWGGSATFSIDLTVFHLVDPLNAVDLSPPFYEMSGGMTITAPTRLDSGQILVIRGIMVCSGTGTLDLDWAPAINNAESIGFTAGSFLDVQLIENT